MSDRLKGKVVAITGGNQGIGLGIAQRFVQEGAAVSICYLSDKPGTEAIIQGFRDKGARAAAIQCDVSNPPTASASSKKTAAQSRRN